MLACLNNEICSHAGLVQITLVSRIGKLNVNPSAPPHASGRSTKQKVVCYSLLILWSILFVQFERIGEKTQIWQNNFKNIAPKCEMDSIIRLIWLIQVKWLTSWAFNRIIAPKLTKTPQARAGCLASSHRCAVLMVSRPLKQIVAIKALSDENLDLKDTIQIMDAQRKTSSAWRWNAKHKVIINRFLLRYQESI